MKITSNENSLAENKVLILYVLDKLKKPITNDDLFQLISVANNMNYFYFKQFLFDLVESKYISSYTKEEQTFYSITEAGKYTLSLTSDMLPGIIKLNIDTKIKSELEQIKEESSISAEFLPHSENDFTVTCRLSENHKTIFEIQTFAGSREQAQAIIDNWQNNASEIYPKILEIINPK